jgi:6-phosphogluconolactonase (cycloisomerase 2 family)
VLALNNEDGKFDVDNEMSPLANLLKANRRIRAWLGTEVQIPFIHEEDGGDFATGELDGVVVGEDGLELEEEDVFAKLDDPSTLPTSVGYSCAFDLTGTYLAVAHGNSPFITIYKRNGDTFTKLANPAALPTGIGRGCAFDPTGTYLVVGHSGSPYITIYKRSGDTFTKLADPSTLPTGNGRGCAFDPTGTYLVVGHSGSPYITIYKRNGDTFTKLANPATLPTGTGYGCAFDLTGTYLAVAHNNSPYITIYKRSGDTFTKLANPATLPTGTGYGCAFDLTGTYLAVAHNNSPYITIYKRNGDTFTKLANPAALPTGIGRGCAFDPTGTYLVVGHSGSPYITIYKRSGDTFTKVADPATLPPSTGYGCAFDPTGTYLAVGHSGSPYITIYKQQFTESGSRISLPLDLSSIGTVKTSEISWQAITPAGTSLKVETSLSTDGGQTWGAWQEATSSGTIPGIVPDMDLSNVKLKTRATLETTDTSVTPKLQNLKIEIYGQGEVWVPLGTFWSLDWDSPDDTLEATVTARDRMELLRKSIYETSPLWVNETLYNIATFVLQDAGLYPGEWVIDPSLQNIVIPYAWFEPISHRDALRLIAEAGLATAYADRDGKIRIESFAFAGETSELTITEDDYFPPLSAPSKQEGVANEIVVTTQPIEPASAPEEVYKSSEPVTVPANTTLLVTVQYSSTPVMDAVASLVDPPAGVGIDVSETVYYAWGAKVAVRNTTSTDQDVIIRVEGKPFKALSKERVAARDEASILDNGVLQYEFPANPLVQTLGQARGHSQMTLLASFKDPRRDIEMTWRGNPALLLGDRITVKGQDYHVIRQEIEWAGALVGQA